MNWYYSQNGQQLGPVPEQELTRLAATGAINANSLVWHDGLADWQPLGTAFPAALGLASAETPQIGGYAVPADRKDLVVQQMREGVITGLPGTVEYGGFWIRFVAKFIDGLILLVPNSLINVLIVTAMKPGAGSATNEAPDPAAMAIVILPLLLNFAIQGLYSVLLVSKYGATWGKMAVGLKVVTENGGKLTVGRATGRFFAELVSSLTLLIGYIIAAFDAEKRALHDHICSTRVIKTR
ncbi:MAG: hypothetical protein JWO08_3833 [Verrucomicrobiaceae bacterium]|nr:hypothetical protein [Verrucomicrobiaceae bacterium]